MVGASLTSFTKARYDACKVHTQLLTLDPNVGPQTKALRFDDVVSVRFVIRSAYNASPTKHVAIAEVEFFGPSRGGGS